MKLGGGCKGRTQEELEADDESVMQADNMGKQSSSYPAMKPVNYNDNQPFKRLQWHSHLGGNQKLSNWIQ